MEILLDNIFVILVNTKISENIGMAARACANMGCPNLTLVNPEMEVLDKAYKTCTRQGKGLVDKIRIETDLAAALEQVDKVYATSARLGGFRRSCVTPAEFAMRTNSALNHDTRIAILFGPEDSGLCNDDIAYAEEIINIDTAPNAPSLNLAQSVLLVLYAIREEKKKMWVRSDKKCAKGIEFGEEMRLEAAFKNILSELGCLHGQNEEYFFQRWRRLLRRLELRKYEYDALMGLCRQIKNRIISPNSSHLPEGCPGRDKLPHPIKES